MFVMTWRKLMNEILREGEGAGGGGGGSEGAAADAGAGAEEVAPASSALSGDDTQAAGGGDDTVAGGEDTQAGGGEAEVEAFDVAKLTLPEGVTLPEEVGGEFAKVLNDPKLSPQERGQALLDLYVKQNENLAKAGAEAAKATWDEMQSKWRDEIKALPEFAGKLDAELGATKQALLAAGAKPEFFAALNLTGAGNNPHIVQMFHKLTQHLREGGGVGGGAKPVSAKSAAAIMYPSMTAKE